jgi:hypothetical protein
VRVHAAGKAQITEALAGRSYQGHFGTRLHFGLGPAQEYDKIEVRWLGGPWEVFPGGAADRLAVIVQGTGKPRE